MTLVDDAPAPLALSRSYDRHEPSAAALRVEIRALAASQPWPTLSWSGLVDGLLALGRTDIPLARLVEGHADALRILAQADLEPAADAVYGVWASRSQQTGVTAVESGSTLVLDGTVRFASGAGAIDRALVPVWLDPATHVLVDLPVGELFVDTGQWRTAAMAVSRSHTVTVQGVRVAAPQRVGEPNFYLSRPAFFPGGVGVAGCWAGGAMRVTDLVLARLRPPVAAPMLVRLGQVRRALVAAVSTLRCSAAELDRLLPRSEPDWSRSTADWQLVATEPRAVVSAAVHTVLDHAERLAGPAGLAYDEDLTRAIHDLRLYVLQANTDNDALLLGSRLLDAEDHHG